MLRRPAREVLDATWRQLPRIVLFPGTVEGNIECVGPVRIALKTVGTCHGKIGHVFLDSRPHFVERVLGILFVQTQQQKVQAEILMIV